MSDTWGTVAGPEILLQRAVMLSEIREFMSERGIIEVDTPVLSLSGNPDPAIESLTTRVRIKGQSHSYFLNTSPEFYLKRMMASNKASVYQLGKVFRNDELGVSHQPEFTMLEWYRPDFDHHMLMSEVVDLLQTLGWEEAEKIEYADVFYQHLNIQPHSSSLEELWNKAREEGLEGDTPDRSQILDFLFSHKISKNLGIHKPTLIYNYPACQAALARMNNEPIAKACRFELFIDGMEIANGYHELTDADEQLRRFEEDNQVRKQRGLSTIKYDQHLIDAMNEGLPDCAGVAVGIERLLMAKTGIKNINDVLPFPLGTSLS